ncbi:hypothetical protein CANARDRAFT_205040, partial [[Candida] arabinofermentans NRRL YB-2248]
PIGYNVPSFPSLHWPLGPSREAYQNSFLYYTSDIWRFTVFWTFIMMVAFYSAAALIAVLTHYKNNSSKNNLKMLFTIFMTYVFVSASQAFISGSLIGVLISEIYKSGQFSMSTWIPFTCSLIVVMFNVVTSYSLTSVLL